MQFALLFSSWQLNLIIIAAIVFAVLFAGNSVLLALFFHKRKKSRLCTEALQQRREQLLEELESLRYYTPKEEDEDEAVIEEVDDIETDYEEDDEAEEDGALYVGDDVRYGSVLAVRDMSALMRERFGLVGEEFDNKRYIVRYTYSFESRLLAASDETKAFYASLMDEVGKYGAVKTRRSFRHERIYTGRKTLGVLVFKGKTLCIALALNPADYAETKYRGKDVADIKRFGATPMLVKITSARRLKYVKDLIAQLANLNNITADVESYAGEYDLAPKNLRELFAADLVKIVITGEAPEDGFTGEVSEGEVAPAAEETAAADGELTEGDSGRYRLKILAVSDMSPLMREQLGFAGEEFEDKRYYVRYTYGFDAKLRSSDEAVKERYGQLTDEVGRYIKLRVAGGFRQQRLCYGRKTVGLILFKGKTLCVALALNPKKYENTKYRGIDVGEIKRFEKTPMLLKITSSRRLVYAKYLLSMLAEENVMEMRSEPVKYDYSADELTLDGYYAEGMVKISVIGEVPEGIGEE